MAKKDKKEKKKLSKLLSIKGINLEGDLVKMITQVTSPNGKIKASKKKKKVIRDACVHTRYVNKRMTKKSPFITSDGKGMVRCKICGEVFPSSFYEEDTVRQRTKDFSAVVTQAAFINQAIDGGDDSANYIASLNIGAKRFPAVYKRLVNVAEKKDKIKKNKKKQQKASIGGWAVK